MHPAGTHRAYLLKFALPHHLLHPRGTGVIVHGLSLAPAQSWENDQVS